MSAPSVPTAARLVGLTAVVVALAAAVAITGGSRATVERSLLLPGFRADEVTMLSITRRDQRQVVLRLSDRAEVIDPVPGPADEAVVRDLLSALLSARADRVTTDEQERWRAGLHAPRVRVVLRRGTGEPTEIDVGRLVPESGQVWLGIGKRAYLVPRWIGDALDRDLAELRIRRPFPGGAPMTGVELHGLGVDLVLAGDPPRRRDEGASVRVAAEARARLGAALDAIVLDGFARGPIDQPRLTVRVLGGTAPAELDVHGPCPISAQHVLVDGSAGVGCVSIASIDALLEAARTLAGADGTLLAPLDGDLDVLVAAAPGAGASPAASSAPPVSPAASSGPGAPSAPSGTDSPAVPDGASAASAPPAVRLARRGAAWTLTLGDAPTTDADDAAVAAFLDALARPGTLGPPPPSRAPDASWTATLAGGSTETWAWWWGDATRPTLFRRDAEPSAIAVDPATAAAARTFGAPLRDLTALTVEPTAVTSITATGASPAALTRGALVGDWNVARPAGAAATPAATALVEALAHVRGLAWLAPSALGRPRRTLTITVDAPPIAGATATTHTLIVGAARADGSCALRIDRFPPLHADATLCATLLAPLAR